MMKHKGFTLIELMIVVIIIMLVISLGIAPFMDSELNNSVEILGDVVEAATHIDFGDNYITIN